MKDFLDYIFDYFNDKNPDEMSEVMKKYDEEMLKEKNKKDINEK